MPSYTPQTWNDNAPPGITAARLGVIENGIRDAYETTGAAAPTTGAHLVGDRVWDQNPVAGGTEGWICTVAGTPGTWQTFGIVSGGAATGAGGVLSGTYPNPGFAVDMATQAEQDAAIANVFITAASPPGAGAHTLGERVWNNAPEPGGNMGWVCTTAGTPGVWKPFGVIGL
jgi:hypothetical protein